MKWLFILLLLSNFGYLGFELDRQTALDFSGTKKLPTIPLGAIQLSFLSELETLPPPRNIELENPLENLAETVQTAEIIEDDSGPGDQTEELSGAETETGEQADSELMSMGPDFQVEERIPQFEVEDSRPQSCFSFGPVAEQEQADNLGEWFIAHGGRAQLRHTDEQGRNLFWVYLSPQESRQDAMDTIRNFREQGIRDFRLIVKGDLQNAISMGVFSSQASVNKRLGELKKQGYKPVVVPYSDGKRVYWVDARLPADEMLMEKVFNDYPSRFNSVPVNCMEIAIALDSS